MNEKEIRELETLAEQFIIGFKKLSKEQRRLLQHKRLVEKNIKYHENRIKRLERIAKEIDRKRLIEVGATRK